MNQLEKDKAKKMQEDPGYDEFEDETDLSKYIEIKDGESGSTVKGSVRGSSNSEIIDWDENSSEYEEWINWS